MRKMIYKIFIIIMLIICSIAITFCQAITAQNITNTGSNSGMKGGGGMNGGAAELTYTGVEKTLTVSNDVKISQRPNMGRQNTNNNSSLATKVSDLKKGQVIMIWYKANTETVERISVIQS